MRRPLRIIDLCWPLAPGMPLFPGDQPLTLTPAAGLQADGYLAHQVSLPSHCGTHVDAPAHVIPGGASLADLPLARFAGAGVVLDLRARPGLAISAGDLAPHLPELRAGGASGPPAFVLIQTGDAERWGRTDYSTRGAHLLPEAAELLAALPLSGLGLDAGSVDPHGSHDLPAHRILLGAGLVLVENLRGLELLPRRGFFFLCLPVLGLDGSPVRAAALVSADAPEQGTA